MADNDAALAVIEKVAIWMEDYCTAPKQALENVPTDIDLSSIQ